MIKTLKTVLVATMIASLTVQVVLAQRFQWPTPGSFSPQSVPNSTEIHNIVEASDGNMVISLNDSGSNGGRLRVQKIDPSDGSEIWTSGGIQVATHGVIEPQPASNFDGVRHTNMIPDGSGGVYIAWTEEVSGGSTGQADLWVQHHDTNGNRLWGSDQGISLGSGGAPFEGHPHLVETPTHLFVGYSYVSTSISSRQPWVVALDKSTGNIDAGFNGGAAVRADDGLSGGRTLYGLVPDGGNGVIAIYNTEVSVGQTYASRINNDGTKAWEHVAVSDGDNVDDESFVPAAVPDGSGGAIVAWRYDEGIGSSTTVAAQRIDNTGTLQWSGGTSTTIDTASSFSTPNDVQVISDGSGGAYFLYEKVYDQVDPPITSSQTVFLARVDSSGSLVFVQPLTPQGLDDYTASVMGNVKGQPYTLALASDGTVLVTWQQCWEDCNNDFGLRESRIEMRRVTNTGTVQWFYCQNVIDNGTAFHPESFFDNIGTDGMFVWGTDFQRISDASVTAPNAISDLSTSISTPGEVDLSWSDPGTPGLSIIDYAVFYSNDGFSSDSNIFFDGLSTNTSATVDGLQNGTEYTFDVRACNQVLAASSNAETASPSSCAGLGAGVFCGSQTISSSTLTFQDIPDTFNFGTITEGSAQDLFNNNTPPDANEPGADDLLQIFDDRNSGGFTVTVDPEATFIDETGTRTIPLSNLYIATSLDETDPGNVGGITYGAGFTGDQTVSAPAYVDVDSASLTDPATYTGLGAAGQFGGSPLVLMDGTLSSGSGREGTMSLFTNFHLHIDASQQDGSYAVVLTYTLADSTT